jgi:2-phospho-L-lactate guanylyltransferase
VHVLVPLKRLDRAKTRLAGSLSVHDRATLMRALVANAAAQAQAASGVERVTLVSSDPAAAALAREHGIEWFDDRALPWNEALTAAMREVVGAELVGIVSADLPLLRAPDLEALAAATPARGAAIARATDAGTNAVFMRPVAGFETCFGVAGSAARHAELARAAGLDAVVVDRPGTAVDLDSPGDVERFLALGERGPLRDLVADLFANRRIAV